MVQNDFTNFSAQAYLTEFYSTLNPENKFLLSFYDKFYKEISHLSSMIEVGGGPTIYQLISASEKVDAITFAEFAQSNREEINKFLNEYNNAWKWDEYISYVLELNHIQPYPEAIEEVKKRLRLKISSVIPCDIRKENPLNPEQFRQFDLLSMGSVADSIASTEKELIDDLKNAFSLIKPDGYFIGFFAKNFTRWTQLDRVYHIYPVNEKYIQDLFPKLGLRITRLTNSVPPDYQQEYEGIFAVSARKVREIK